VARLDPDIDLEGGIEFPYIVLILEVVREGTVLASQQD